MLPRIPKRYYTSKTSRLRMRHVDMSPAGVDVEGSQPHAAGSEAVVTEVNDRHIVYNYRYLRTSGINSQVIGRHRLQLIGRRRQESPRVRRLTAHDALLGNVEAGVIAGIRIGADRGMRDAEDQAGVATAGWCLA